MTTAEPIAPEPGQLGVVNQHQPVTAAGSNLNGAASNSGLPPDAAVAAQSEDATFRAMVSQESVNTTPPEPPSIPGVVEVI